MTRLTDAPAPADPDVLAALTAALAGAQRDLAAVASSVSHDLRAPLRAIDGFSRLALEEAGPDAGEQLRHYLERIRAAGDRMSRLIDGLLRLLQAGQDPLHRRPVDVTGLARRIAGRLAEADPGRAVALDVAGGLVADADPDLLAVALENLMANAWKFTARRAAARIEVGVGAGTGAGSPVFFVRDNGAGFDMGHAAHLFALHRRLHSAAEFEGTGAGLAIAARIVDRHGGRIWAEAEPDRGATFFFTLPAGVAS